MGKSKSPAPSSSEDTTPIQETKEMSIMEDDAKKRKEEKQEKKRRKREKKEKKKRSRTSSETSITSDPSTDKMQQPAGKKRRHSSTCEERPMVESSAQEFVAKEQTSQESQFHKVTLLLFYQYVEPPWSNEVYKYALSHVEQLGKQANISGRMRIAREGLNCTLTGSRDGILTFCRSLRRWKPECFEPTEFKLTHDLPDAQRFSNLKMIPVTELVHYGLDGAKAPPIQQYHGTHLEPEDYHTKLAEDDTVVIDVRNHYEATIGHFQPPSDPSKPNGPQWIDPKMRKSTEFPVWLDDPKTKETLKGKQVLMYCTGGIRCERASALLKYKMDTDPTVKDLNIKGVYQLQGGIDKYFKAFPDGGYWQGKNYVFDKRFAHAPPVVEERKSFAQPMGKCEACLKPWDKYGGKRRCPACGVPSLICRHCMQADKDKIRKLDRFVRCDLCVEQKVFSKKEMRAKEQQQIDEYEARVGAKGLLLANRDTETKAPTNSGGTTRLFLKNMCRKSMTDDVLSEFLPGITHILWRMDRKTNQFFGQGWAEMESPEAAARAVAKSGQKVLGRPIHINYQPPDGKDAWPPPNSAVAR
ncbi:predicted protein [Phaeodactylum tricornutum CCAP 1055/1]|jgi:predicted sulfurtransferase|uniref:Rhodanese domain-containing protein n=1 Tax=Phaeodactylum tricornutum (strain CCAP 1055/1) TaxID=556484 RepID=B7G7U4_PHATC|nr:predicted protein [Phaeodactylum tricornutum CCAP 1055/1]EEC45426.1 predicted protein [Phaeodactylum tricornutum CCAP 1055/1]|eukprot:XP_002183208.1 predicted protein [Phaeodactylum tricornutum CCAP 1055/1]